MYGIMTVKASAATRLLILLFILSIPACAIDNGDPDGEIPGYKVCETDEDCGEEGICIEAEPDNYCGAACSIDLDCVVDDDSDITYVCINSRCVDESTIEEENGEDEN